jgi:hypothetical protein
LACLFLLALGLTGCVSHSTATNRAQKAFYDGRQAAQAEQQAQQQPAVWFRGDVRNTRVPWSEGLTLAQALAAAQYTWTWDPRTITVTRNGQAYAVNPRQLLRGTDDPVLEPGDVVEVRH